MLCLDGVYVRYAESGELVFEELGTPTGAEVLEVARRTSEHLDELLRKSGRSLEREADEPVPALVLVLVLVLDEPGLASCYCYGARLMT